MNKTDLMRNEFKKLYELCKKESEYKKILSTNKLRQQFVPNIVKGIIKTGDFKTNLGAGLICGGTILLIEVIREQLLADIERQKAQINQRITALSKSIGLPLFLSQTH